MKNRRILLGHISFWIFYTVFNYAIARIQMISVQLYFIEYIAKYSFAAMVFYANILFILPKFYPTKKIPQLILSLIVLFWTVLFLQRVVYLYLLPLGGFPKVTVYDIWHLAAIELWWWFQYTLFGFGYWFAMDSLKKEKAIRALVHHNLMEVKRKSVLEKEKLLAEQAFLRAQINPHFLYNVLNFLYYKSLVVSQDLAEGILTLSAIMRYSFMEDEKGSGKINLTSEIEHLNNLIKINQFRFSGNMNIHFEPKGDFNEVKIIPFILVTLVENAFKHGELMNPDHPVTIALNYDKLNKVLELFISNRKAKKIASPSQGIGLNNLRRRLDQWYPDNFYFDINNNDQQYAVHLKINL
jgi:two-component system LytT family sensor kinase